MKFSKLPLPRFSAPPALFLAAVAGLFQPRAEEGVFEVGGAGWIQYGRVGNSSDPENGTDLDGNSIYSSGAQLSVQARISERVDGVTGIGVAYGHTLPSAITKNGGYAPAYLAPYVAEAYFTAHFIKEENSGFFLRGGLFPYSYNPEVRNLGSYLLRGPLYPGVLLSGFEERNGFAVASMVGVQLHNRSGSFQQDLIVNSETDFFPYFDLSVAYVANCNFSSAFRLGGGVNFYHLIPITDSITSGKWDVGHSTFVDSIGANPDGTPINDSTLIGFSGTKLMVNAAFDPKLLFGGPGILGAEDLKIYGEIALLGLDNGPAYKKLYGDYLHRMPMMIGLNLPMFGFLDRLAFETEWYGSPVKDDLAGFNHTASSHQNALPLKDANGKYINYKRDNWKWSLYGSRIVQGHVRISFQVANDHFRPGIYTGDGDNNAPGSQALMTTPKDWYTMFKVAYFF
ncbi:MAG TPA: hypothetical protein VJ385_07820 [Fibrobacteria bacterium]|nr:hypothetical protein [Fibrobacteria bacterium]